MIAAVVAVLAAVVGFAVLAPPLGRRLPPAVAVWLLVPGAVVVAACSGFVLAVVAFLGLGQLPLLAAWGPWSAHALDVLDPIPDPVAAGCGIVLVALAAAAGVAIARRVRDLVGVYRIYLCGPRPVEGLTVLDDDRPQVFATPAPRGRVVITTGLLGALTVEERQVVLAHERAHLRARHIWWRMAADLAAAANPLLRPTAATVGYVTERAADEHAARIAGDRTLVARTVARVALLHQDGTGAPHRAVAAATGGQVPRRAQALLAPAPSLARWAVVVLAGLLLAGTLATATVGHSTERIFEHAAPPAATHLPASQHPRPGATR